MPLSPDEKALLKEEKKGLWGQTRPECSNQLLYVKEFCDAVNGRYFNGRCNITFTPRRGGHAKGTEIPFDQKGVELSLVDRCIHNRLDLTILYRSKEHDPRLFEQRAGKWEIREDIWESEELYKPFYQFAPELSPSRIAELLDVGKTTIKQTDQFVSHEPHTAFQAGTHYKIKVPPFKSVVVGHGRQTAEKWARKLTEAIPRLRTVVQAL